MRPEGAIFGDFAGQPLPAIATGAQAATQPSAPQSFILTKDRPTRLLIGLIAGLLCAVELPFTATLPPLRQQRAHLPQLLKLLCGL
jgi:hypothetical protein